jgi:hypothetical protein
VCTEVPHGVAQTTPAGGRGTVSTQDGTPSKRDSDIVLIVDAPSGDHIAKFALSLGALGNVRTRTARAWTESEFQKLVSELP